VTAKHDPRKPLPDPELEADVQAGVGFLAAGVEPQVVLSAMALTALRRPEIETDVMRAIKSLKKHKPPVVLRALVMTIRESVEASAQLTAGDVLGIEPQQAGIVLPIPQAVSHRPMPSGPRNLSPMAGGVAPSGAPDPATFGEQNF